MLARGWCQAGVAASWLVFLVGEPAQAGWDYYSHPFLYSFARQAMRQALIYEVHRLNSPQRSQRSEPAPGRTSQSQASTASAPRRTGTSHHATAYNGTARDSHNSPLRYPTDEKLVPPPPPYEPVLYPTAADGAPSSKKPAGASPMVPPPPPAPSVWSDVQQRQN